MGWDMGARAGKKRRRTCFGVVEDGKENTREKKNIEKGRLSDAEALLNSSSLRTHRCAFFEGDEGIK